MKQIFDYQQAIKVTGGDVTLFWEMVALFQELRPALQAEVTEAVAAADPAAIRRAAHALVRTLANLGGVAAADLARELEAMGREEKLDGARATWQKLRHEIEEFIAAISLSPEASPGRPR